jgi:hypothetical protein
MKTQTDSRGEVMNPNRSEASSDQEAFEQKEA